MTDSSIASAMTDETTWYALPAPAKLNLFLRITGRRADGYHLLQTAFQFIDLVDTIHLRLRDDTHILLQNPHPEIPAEQDLVIRAARLLQTFTGCQRGVDLRVDKRIPMGAGLGGGSSDAATVLYTLNQLWQLALADETLIRLGMQLGADVPVFLGGQAAWAEGIGEQLTTIHPEESLYLLVVPPVHVSTAAIFGHPALTRNNPPIRISDLLDGHCRNELETVVRREYAEVDAVFRWLANHGDARMTGTGAGVFIILESEQQGRQIVQQVPPAWQAFLVRGQNRSPLQRELSALNIGV